MIVIKDVEKFRKAIVEAHLSGDLGFHDALENLELTNLNEVEAEALLGYDLTSPSRARALNNTSSLAPSNSVPVKTA